MDGIAIAGAMTATPDIRATCGRFVFSLAREADDAALRRLLRENPMGGRVSVSLEREPSVFHAAAVEGDEHYVLIARDAETGRAVAMGSVAVRERFVNGSPGRVGYLGQLRLDRRWRGRGDVVRAGYRFLREIHDHLGLSHYFTSIVMDNLAARRLLEAGVRGMPRYRPIETFRTFLMPSGRRCRATSQCISIECGSVEHLPQIVECLNRNGERYQFCPCWNAEALASPVRARGLRPEDLFLATRGGRVVGCMALWKQDSFKQIVVRGYSTPLRWLRPVVNVGSRVIGGVALPRVGEVLPHAFVSHVAVDEDDPQVFESLLSHARGVASDRLLVLGFSVRHPLADVMQRYRCRTYDSTLYAVEWSDAPDSMRAQLHGRVVHPEVALL
jgi:RimJ/RimL family protein N-acetyltransferase